MTHDVAVQVRGYLAVFGTLFVLTIVTVAVSYLHLPHVPAVAVALTIAAFKATLVALFFMHLKFEGKLIYLIVTVPLILCVLLTCALIPDILMTDHDSSSASLHLFNAPPIPK
jgi:cytochrome c oxidase subunit 4